MATHQQQGQVDAKLGHEECEPEACDLVEEASLVALMGGGELVAALLGCGQHLLAQPDPSHQPSAMIFTCWKARSTGLECGRRWRSQRGDVGE